MPGILANAFKTWIFLKAFGFRIASFRVTTVHKYTEIFGGDDLIFLFGSFPALRQITELGVRCHQEFCKNLEVSKL